MTNQRDIHSASTHNALAQIRNSLFNNNVMTVVKIRGEQCRFYE